MSRPETSAPAYEILDEVGRGSIAVVLHARDPIASRDVAIKTFLRPNGISTEEWQAFRERLQRQAERAQRLSHRGIASLYEVGESAEDGAPFIAMEWVQGPTLHELIRKEQALDPAWALKVTDTLAEALDHAHRAGVLHPDFKPANVIVRESDGIAKITDFGVARIGEADGSSATHGTPAYRAPECAGGRAAELRSELFTLSVILYEMLCGKPPFGGKTAGLIRESIAEHDPTPITEQAGDIAPAFDAFFRRALSKRPEDRFQDVATFRSSLAAVRHAQSDFRAVSNKVGPVELEAPSGTAALPLAAPASTPAASAPAAKPPKTPDRPAASRAPAASKTAPARKKVPPAHRPAPRETNWSFAGWLTAAVVVAVMFVAAIAWVWTTADRVVSPDEDAPTGLRVSSPQDSHPTKPAVPLVVVSPPAASEKPEAVPPPPPAAKSAPPPAAVEKAPAPAPVKKAQSAPQKPKTAPPAAVKPAAPAPAPAPVVAAVERAPAPHPTARLDVQLKNNLKEGRLSLFLDGDEIYSTDLESDDGRLARAFKKTVGKAGQRVGTELEIPAGAHTLSAHLLNTAKSKEFDESIEIDLDAGSAGTLRIITGRTFGRDLALRLE